MRRGHISIQVIDPPEHAQSISNESLTLHTLSAHLCLCGSKLKKSLTSSSPSPVTDEVRNTGARESVCMCRAHVKTSSLLLTCTGLKYIKTHQNTCHSPYKYLFLLGDPSARGQTDHHVGLFLDARLAQDG